MLTKSKTEARGCTGPWEKAGRHARAAASNSSTRRRASATSWPYQRLGVRADIGHFLHEHADHLLTDLVRIFSPGVILAEYDAGARAWLLKVEAAQRE